MIANLIACSIFSQLLGKTKNVIEYMSIFLSLFVVVPIFACIKPEPDQRQLDFETYAVFIPSVAYLQDLRLNVQRGFAIYDTYPIQILLTANCFLIPTLIVLEFYKGQTGSTRSFWQRKSAVPSSETPYELKVNMEGVADQ